MKWSWKLGKFAGIGVYIHAMFLLILGWVAMSLDEDTLSNLKTILENFSTIMGNGG